jgi:hypothetical protein
MCDFLINPFINYDFMRKTLASSFIIKKNHAGIGNNIDDFLPNSPLF